MYFLNDGIKSGPVCSFTPTHLYLFTYLFSLFLFVQEKWTPCWPNECPLHSLAPFVLLLCLWWWEVKGQTHSERASDQRLSRRKHFGQKRQEEQQLPAEFLRPGLRSRQPQPIGANRSNQLASNCTFRGFYWSSLRCFKGWKKQTLITDDQPVTLTVTISASTLERTPLSASLPGYY